MFNNLYEKECKKYPAFPKFSIWRLMVFCFLWKKKIYNIFKKKQKVWIAKVFNKFEQKLMFSFLIIVDYNRCFNLSKTLIQIEPNSEHKDKILNLIDSLFQDHTINLLTKHGLKISKAFENFENIDTFNYSNFNHDFFNKQNSDLFLNVASS